MKVRWSPTARESLRDIVAYHRAFSRDSARKWRSRITQRAESLADLPWRAREVPEAAEGTVREAFEGPYRIWFQIRNNEVLILVVFHGARQVPD